MSSTMMTNGDECTQEPSKRRKVLEDCQGSAREGRSWKVVRAQQEKEGPGGL